MRRRSGSPPLQRSNVESTFSAIKRVFGDFVRSKGKTARINEVLPKIICHNVRQVIFAIFELGIAPTFCTDGLSTSHQKYAIIKMPSKNIGIAGTTCGFWSKCSLS